MSARDVFAAAFARILEEIFGKFLKTRWYDP